MPNPGGTPDIVADLDAGGTADEVVDTDSPDSFVASFNGRAGAVIPAQADYDSFFLTQTEGDARYAELATANTFTDVNTFSHASGVTTDTVTERTAAAGVTVDGVLLKDGGGTFSGIVSGSNALAFYANLASSSDIAFLAAHTAAFTAFEILGSGLLRWSPGNGAGADIVLSRGAANRLDLATGDSFNLVSGGFMVAATQVVGAQGAAVADATDAATAITQLNALLARQRTHGLIAT